MVSIFCKNNNISKTFHSGSSLLDIYEGLELNIPYGPVAARVNNKIEGLKYRIYTNKDIEFINIADAAGMRLYIHSLTFVLMKAVNDLFPHQIIRLENPISKGYYCRMDNPLSEDEIMKIRERMGEIIQQNIPFERVECHTAEAIELFSRSDRPDRVKLLETYNSLYTSYYQLGDFIDYFYGSLLPCTGYIKLFEIEKFGEGLLLRVPNKLMPNTLEDKVPQEKLQERFSERHRWQQIMGVETIGDFNKMVLKGYGVDLVNVSEALQEKKIVQIAENISSLGRHVALISGPSSSGKTTFSKRLSIQLAACGLRPFPLSLDDYFLDRTLTPRDEKGDYDFESVYSIDLPFFNEQLKQILSGKEVELPRYNFQLGTREFKGKKIKLDERMILVIEGTHALNPLLTEQIPEKEKFKIYVSALTSIQLDYHNYISTSDTRLLRRILRDYKYRGYSALETIQRWPDVQKGEERWIYPYQENADVMFNSALLYELSVLRWKVEPLLRTVPKERKEYSEVSRLLRFLEYIVPLQDDELPPTSLLREFLGGSSLKY